MTKKCTAYNVRLGATAAGSADLKGSARIRRCVKPPLRCRQCADSAVRLGSEKIRLNKVENNV